MLYLWTKIEDDRYAFISITCGAIEPGETGDVVFPISVYVGSEDMSLLISADPNHNRVMWEGTISFPKRVEQQLTCSNLSIENCNYGVLKDSEAHISFNITNTGENIYNDIIGYELQMKINNDGGLVVKRNSQQVLLNAGETKTIDFVIPHLENNRYYYLYFHYYGENANTFIFNDDYSPISFLVAKNYIEYEGINYSYSPNSRTAIVITGDYQNQESITIPSTITVEGTPFSVTEIAPSAFKGCQFQSVNLPEGLLSIGMCAFQYSQIKSITFPSTLKSVGRYTFNSADLNEVSLSEGTVSVNYSAFSECSIGVLRLPSTLESIVNGVYFNCNNLKSVYSAMNNPIEIADNTFVNVPLSATLYVPKGSVSKYQEAAGWNVFTKITDKLPYKLTYYVDGEIYKSYEIEEETPVTAEENPTKEGYTFSGWSEIPETMPDHDVTVTGTFNRDFILGDVNNDSEINVADVVSLVNYILQKPSEIFVVEAADVNHDELINIADVVCIVNVILGKSTLARMRHAAQQDNTTNDRLTLVNIGRELRLNLENQAQYVAAQFDVRMPEGQKIVEISLAERTTDLQLSYARIDNHTVRVLLYGLNGEVISGQCGELLNMKLSDEVRLVEVDNIQFVTSNLAIQRFDDLHASPTGIHSVENSQYSDAHVYDMQGNRLDGARKGVNIIRTRDGKTKKVMVK